MYKLIDQYAEDLRLELDQISVIRKPERLERHSMHPFP